MKGVCNQMSEHISKWHRELEIFDKIKPIIILEGNILDNYPYPVDGQFITKGAIMRLDQYLYYYFKEEGYTNIIFYDSLKGFYNDYETDMLSNFGNMIGQAARSGSIPAPFKDPNRLAVESIKKALTQKDQPTVVIMNFSSRYTTGPSAMQQPETDAFTTLIQASMQGQNVKTDKGLLKNLIVMIANKVNDLPAWFYLENPNVKSILISKPTKEERELLIKGNNFRSFFSGDVWMEEKDYYEENPDELEKIQNRFVGLTEGFSFTELNDLRRLSKLQDLHIKDVCSVIDLYKFGIKENPWNSLNYDSMKNMYAHFEKRVKGQEVALTKTIDVVKRAMTGMSGIQSSSTSKPKGVLFFAGPTGTGKTETAKTLAQELFGDEKNCIRFDMSEYGQSHSDQKLLGAPPGYVGYEAGGQLTNAVKNNPFSILLFDEIEKAHPSIMDKFLQILEDGRMTDGQGNTVYFSETIIIFTSNLGIYQTDRAGQRHQVVDQSMPYEELEKKVKEGIKDYFNLELGRPEILNRIGENIVVFDFIRENVAKSILESQVKRIVDNLYTEKNISVSINQKAMQVLLDHVFANLNNGGRGIGNIVESLLVNPLSRYLFDNAIFEKAEITITDIQAEKMPYYLTCDVTKV